MNVINKILKGDKVIWVVALLLGLISLVVVYSATSALVENNYGGSSGRLLLKHGGTLLIGFIMMFVAYRIDYRKYAGIFGIVLWLCIPLLLYTMLFGKNLNEASRTINLLGFSFQPSELAKIALITYLSRELMMLQDKLHSFKQILLPIVVPILVTTGLIFTENLSTAAILLVACLVLLFIGRVKIMHILAILGIGIVLLGFYILYDMAATKIKNNRALRQAQTTEVVITEGQDEAQAAPFIRQRKSRIETWINRVKAMSEEKKMKAEGTYDPFDDHHYQQTYAKIAVASSRFIGKGPGKSEQRNFLPHPYSDFIYAIIIEEYGIIGAFIVMLLYVILLTRALKIVTKRTITFGSYMAFGLTFLLIMQAMINMGVSTGLLPVTGQPLPFVSMGGSSMLATGFSIGMILSVTRSIEKQKEAEQQQDGISAETEQQTENTEVQ
ncbi:MAG: FtsW/RodA/SpoVE family cell cycle protein [Candidatus Limimorpha sp.]